MPRGSLLVCARNWGIPKVLHKSAGVIIHHYSMMHISVISFTLLRRVTHNSNEIQIFCFKATCMYASKHQFVSVHPPPYMTHTNTHTKAPTV